MVSEARERSERRMDPETLERLRNHKPTKAEMHRFILRFITEPLIDSEAAS
jgi:hypothetical protein